MAAQAGAEDLTTTQRVTIYSNGYATDMCDGGPSSYFCYDRLKRRAGDDAARDADIQCRIRNGRIEAFSGYCSNFCNPFSLPNNAPMQFVRCNANCTSTCVIESRDE